MDERGLESLPSSKEEEARSRYYRAEPMPSPAGGELEPMHVRTRDEGSALLIVECSASSVRYGIPIPKATSSERKRVREMVKADEEPFCPRHGPAVRLTRVGEALGCKRCGVTFATVR